MRRRLLLLILLVPIVLVLAAVGTFFIGDKFAVDHLSITRVIPDQLAKAMEGDYFYSSYRESTLILSGTIFGIDRSKNPIQVIFTSNSNYQVRCTLGLQTSLPVTGSTITVLSEGAQAERLSSGVLLHDCVLP